MCENASVVSAIRCGGLSNPAINRSGGREQLPERRSRRRRQQDLLGVVAVKRGFQDCVFLGSSPCLDGDEHPDADGRMPARHGSIQDIPRGSDCSVSSQRSSQVLHVPGPLPFPPWSHGSTGVPLPSRCFWGIGCSSHPISMHKHPPSLRLVQVLPKSCGVVSGLTSSIGKEKKENPIPSPPWSGSSHREKLLSAMDDN